MAKNLQKYLNPHKGDPITETILYFTSMYVIIYSGYLFLRPKLLLNTIVFSRNA